MLCNSYSGKYPRPVVTLEQRSEDDTYDRIGQNVSVEANEETQLLPSGQDMEERSVELGCTFKVYVAVGIVHG